MNFYVVLCQIHTNFNANGEHMIGYKTGSCGHIFVYSEETAKWHLGWYTDTHLVTVCKIFSFDSCKLCCTLNSSESSKLIDRSG